MKKAEIPAVLADVERIAGRFFETDNIGIVPDNENVQFSDYIPRVFAGMNAGDARNLPETGDPVREKVEKAAEWLDEKPVELV